MAKVTVKSAKARAWKTFSRYIRQKYSDKNGICTCVTCGVRKPWNEMQAGHAFASRCNNILFCEDIVRPQCYSCNVPGGGKYDEYHAWVLKEYGQDGYDKLLRLKHGKDEAGNDVITKFTIDSLEEMIKEWRSKLRWKD